ncbi:DUF397 domain-containing protein [Streptomyces noursei]|uniref:DUF397 domain-containing protein n=1 Tax=Streptomyces noursei TaxID=1971 RepID=A0A401R031_STRNR|nr:DUF397 domain-containing protein [Streptomyces noursei]AKA03697.1 toxin [Streptomyces noursei ZPM]EOS99876.1 hypothetical protein K530_31693 [Streptomyces noursei CCRC 11814]EXU85365.1 hypothetical protein P354_10895 [Streptomyces noursei PD-1]MCZ0973231.1 DUF397 domain-containing protein [Streptomyces noursei]UWS72088.1 DUF397 domain-containing protein [Streptomyces noursei]
MTTEPLNWIKSSYSGGNGGTCVEVATNVPGVVPVRDSKDPHGPHLTLTADAFADLIAFAKTHG